MARKKSTDLVHELVMGVDEQNRRIYFGNSLDYHVDWDADHGDFRQSSVEYCIRAIHRMAAQHPRTPIEIHMNSYGGDTYAMLALYDVIQSCTCQIKFFGAGAIMSAASFIMAGCDERYLYPNAKVMLHELSTYQEGKLTDIKIDSKECENLMDQLLEIYAENSRMNFDFWKEATKRDLYLTPEEAIALGLADRVVPPKKRGNYRKIRQYQLSRKINRRKMNKLVESLLDRTHSLPKNFEVCLKEPTEEPIDENLVIEPMPEQEETNEKPDSKETNKE